MKNLFNKKASIVIFSLLLSGLARGAVVINQLRGNAFMIYDTKTQSLHVGDHIPAGAEVLTEEGTELTFSNYYHHQFHITGSSHLKVNKKDTILFEGYLWFRSVSKGRLSPLNFKIKTANGVVRYNDTEGIVSFDPHKVKTQFLGLRGNNIFFHKSHPGPRYEVKSGMFSVIDNKDNRDTPRPPSPLGLKSYKKLMVLFDGTGSLPVIPRFRKKLVPARAIASIGESGEGGGTGEQNGFKKMLRQHSHTTGPARIKINVFAPTNSPKSTPTPMQNPQPQQPKKEEENYSTPTIRLPASLPPPNPNNPFEEALQSRYKDKMRHNKEINSLIDTLKSVNQDYYKNP